MALSIEETLTKCATMRYRKVLAEYPSMSKPGLTYKVRRGAEGELQCECREWRFSPKEPKACQHTIAFEASCEGLKFRAGVFTE